MWRERHGGRRRDAEPLDRVLRDLLEQGSRGDPAVDRGRFVQDRRDDDPRVPRRQEPDERRDVAVRVVAAGRGRLQRGPGLAGDLVAGDLRAGPGPVLDDVREHLRQDGRRLRLEDAFRRGRGRGREPSPSRPRFR